MHTSTAKGIRQSVYPLKRCLRDVCETEDINFCRKVYVREGEGCSACLPPRRNTQAPGAMLPWGGSARIGMRDVGAAARVVCVYSARQCALVSEAQGRAVFRGVRAGLPRVCDLSRIFV